MNEKEQIVLAIETASQIPSVSILRNSDEIDFWVGDENTTGSESLLPAVFRLLQNNRIHINEIDLLAVSLGPGSFTGVRIGLATAKGLSLGGKLKNVGVNTLEALAVATENTGTVRSIIGGGRTEYFVQDFNIEKRFQAVKLTEPKLQRFDKVLDELYVNSNITIISDHIINQSLLQNNVSNTLVIRPRNLARFVGLAASEKVSNEDLQTAPELKPIYVRQADFEKMVLQ